MKKHITKYLCICLLFFYSLPNAQSQSLSTAGKEFWMGFMENFGAPEALVFFITSQKNTSGTVAIPGSGFSQNFSVTANSTTTVNVPVNIAHSVGAGIKNNAVRILSQDTISVFAINNLANTTDATVVLPKPALDVQPTYVVSSYLGGSNISQYMIVGIDNNTPIQITNPNGTVQNITLNQGQTYQVQLAGIDISGTIITTTDDCKTFAVFAGVQCANVPDLTCTRCDHIFSQLYPTFTWGTEYLATPFGEGSRGGFSLEQTGGYLIRIFREDLSTTATVNGAPITWNGLNGRFHEINVNDFTTRCISASAPISVTQYMKGQQCNGLPPQFDGNTLAKGDPSMLVLNPNNQTVTKAVFNTVTTNNLSDHFVNIIIKTEDLGCVSLDGSTLGTNNFEPFPNCPDYSFARVKIANGSHVVECPNGLIAYCYGIGERESYAYTAGASFENLQFRAIIEDEFNIATNTGSVQSCTGVEMNFSAEGEGALSYTWNFGDGSPEITGEVANHTYNNPGNYEVVMTVTIQAGCGTREVEIRRNVNVLIFPNVDFQGNSTTILCANGDVQLDAGNFGSNVNYTWSNGGNTQVITVDQPGVYTVTATNAVGCSSTNSITVNEVPRPTLEFTNLGDSYCADATPVELLETVLPNEPASSSFTINGTAATTFNPATLGAGTYTVVFNYVDATTGCDNQISKQVVVNPLPVLTINLPTAICEDEAVINLFEAVTPSNTSNGSFTVNGVATSTLDPSVLPQSQPIAVVYTYTEASTGCVNSIEQALQINPLPAPVFIDFPNRFCANEVINFYDFVNPANTNTGRFLLNQTSIDDFGDAQNFSFESLAPNQTYTFTYLYTDPNTNCQNSIDASFQVIPFPILNFINLNELYCPNEPAFALADRVNRTGGTFTLDNNPVTAIDPAALVAGRVYTLTYTFTDQVTQCTNTISQNISTPAPPSFIDLALVYCQEGGAVTLNANPVGGTLRLNGEVITTLDPALYAAGFYTLSYTDANNCASIATEIEILPNADPVEIISNQDICSSFGERLPVVLDAREGITDPSRDVTYTWLDTDVQTPTLTVTQSGSYTVEVLNSLNCIEKRTFIVEERADCEPRIFIPDAFSPNADGLNDQLEVFGLYFIDFKISIYNRWGELVYQAFRPEDTWNGTFRGQDAPTGVYVIQLEYRLLSDFILQKETRKLTLLR